MLNTLKELCLIPGVSGREERVREYIRVKAEPYAAEIITDTLGNLLVHTKGIKSTDKKIMLAAHMDEVGIIITYITDEGYLKFDFVGSVDRRVVIGKQVFIGDNMIPGVIGLKPPHLSVAEERSRIPKVTELYIDIGADSKELAAELVSLGDVGCFDLSAKEFGDGFVRAKAIDDRIGCCILLELMKDMPVDAWFAFTVQEEVGLRGSLVAANRLRPDLALIFEGTTAADLPSQSGAAKVCVPGMGPVLPFMDNGTITDRGIFKDLTAAADKNGIPWQTKTYISGGTDAAAIQRSCMGVKVAGIAAAVRYIHSPSCVACVKDFDNILKLAKCYLETL